MLLSFGLLIIAIIVLFFGAEFSLDSSEKVGKKLGLSPLVIGMLLVGFGTSLPEFFVGHIAALKGSIGIAVGTLVGSNIANMFLILGVCGLFTQLRVSDISLRKHLLIHLVLAPVIAFVLTQSNLNIFTSSPLLILCALYLWVLYKEMKSETKKEDSSEESDEPFNAAVVLIKLIAGFSMLYLGGELLVKSGTDICLALGIEEFIVSAIFIAFGTSFPELVTALMAAFKKKDTDLIIGNIVGSNMFNCAFILGSLGIYNFDISGNYIVEIIALILGAGILYLLSFAKKDFHFKASITFLSIYAVVVLNWVGVLKFI